MADGKDTVQNRYAHAVNHNLDREAVHGLYAKWAETYDQDAGVFGHDRRAFVSGITKELFGPNKKIKILDVGAGTGIAGEMLLADGYEDIDALDGCPEMLKVAKRKNIYKRMICEYIGPTRVDIEDGTYDFLMCLGSLIPTHVNEEAFEEMIRITKPGGYIVFMIGLASIGEAKTRIDAAIQKLHDDGKWEWVVKRIIENYHKVEGPEPTRGLQYAFKIRETVKFTNSI